MENLYLTKVMGETERLMKKNSFELGNQTILFSFLPTHIPPVNAILPRSKQVFVLLYVHYTC